MANSIVTTHGEDTPDFNARSINEFAHSMHRDRHAARHRAGTGGWISRMLKGEWPDPAFNAPRHRAREEKSSPVKHQVTVTDGQDLRMDFKKKS